MSNSAETIVVLHEGQNAVAKCGNMVLAVWASAPTTSVMHAIHQAHLELLEEHPCVAHLALINDTPRIPTTEARQEATKYNRQSQMSSIAVVLEGDGFWLSTARGFLTAVLFAQRGPTTQVFKHLGDAIAWQREILDEAPGSGDLRSGVQSLRELVER